MLWRFFIDNRWWFLIFPFVIILIGTLYVWRSDIANNASIYWWGQQITLWSIPLVLIMVITNAITIIPLWWLGLFVVGAQVFVFFWLFPKIYPMNKSKRERRLIPIILLSMFIGQFFFFSLPTYVSNDDKKTNVVFHSGDNYSRYVVEVTNYSLYGPYETQDTEHVVPQSWFLEDEDHYRNDYVNMVRSNRTANAARGNYPYGNVAKTEENILRSANGKSIVGYCNDKYFMPTNEYKGDVARITLYMYAKYKNNGLDISKIYVNLMKAWSRIDPISKLEKERNQKIGERYYYTNKFVSSSWLTKLVF